MNSDNIVAIATGHSLTSAIGIIRISGSNLKSIVFNLTKQEYLQPRYAYYQKIYNISEDFSSNNSQNQLIDIALVIYFEGPKSFTGEDVLEIHAHGNHILLNNIVNSCLKLGCRMAKAGEFSQRAYLNGKLDLVQAESIADLINAQSQVEIKGALASLQGNFSKRIYTLNQHLVKLRVFVEASLDFPEEDIEFIANEKVVAQMTIIEQQMINLLSSVQQGVLLTNGAKIIIIGQPNVGKSSLFNVLADEDLAIVTDIAGTTRDLLQQQILINGVTFNLLDSAGIRDSDDIIEQIGVNKAVTALTHADICVLLIDISLYDSCTSDILNKIKDNLSSATPLIIVFNKIDKIKDSALLQSTITSLTDLLNKKFDQHLHKVDYLAISVKEKLGLELLRQKILAAVGYNKLDHKEVFTARNRHLNAVKASKKHLGAAVLLAQNNQLELLAEELRLAHDTLSSITGDFVADDLLGEIFSSFCIGK